jgi:sugar lactone lactonase YvrE
VNQNINNEDFVTVFAPGSTHALATVDTHFGGYALVPGEMAFDPHGNLIFSSETFRNGAHIFKMKSGSLKVTELNVNVGVDGEGLAIDGAGNMYVSGFFNAPGIQIFAPGAKNPTRSISHGATALTVKSDGTLYAMTESGVAEYAPGGSEPVNSFSAPVQGFGIALGPVR